MNKRLLLTLSLAFFLVGCTQGSDSTSGSSIDSISTPISVDSSTSGPSIESTITSSSGSSSVESSNPISSNDPISSGTTSTPSSESTSSSTPTPPISVSVSINNPGNYYDGVSEDLYGDDLKRALSTITSAGFITHSYDDLKRIYPKSDTVDGKMIMFYTGTARTFSGNSLPSKTNREHVWPQSWYGAGGSVHSAGSPGADAHNVFPCDSQLNNVRSSFAFDEIEQELGIRVYEGGSSGSYGEGGGGNLNYGDINDLDTFNYADKPNKIFYPRKGYRGMTARTLFYVATRYFNDSRYPVELVDVPQTSESEGKYGRIGKLSTLLKWNIEEPPTEFEIKRNEVIYDEWHNNRNPFIDNSSFACRIWKDYNNNTRQACALEEQAQVQNKAVIITYSDEVLIEKKPRVL